jgi:Protein of unknown function (DUF5661)
MRLRELFENRVLDKPTPTVKELAKKYNVSIEKIETELAKGTKVEMEHTTDPKVAREIALDHLSEKIDYYDKLKQVEEDALNELNVSQTLKFIQQAHGDQLYGKLPYWRHPRSVALTGKKVFGKNFNSDAVKVAFLHDVVEDTATSLDDLSKMDFTPEVIEAVGLLTKNKSLTYVQNIEKIINSGNKLAMMVKYADNYENYTGDKSSWDPKKAEASQKKYLNSLNMLGDKLGVKHHIGENFADGKGPGRPGDSQRHGIPKGATMAQLEKAAKAKGRKGQLARWQLNMRRGKKK